MSQEAAVATFELVYPDGVTYAVPREQLWDMLNRSHQLQEATVSVKEGRSRAKYTPSDRFLSMNMNFRPAWGIANMASGNPQMHDAAIFLTRTSIQKTIMETENWLRDMVGAMLAKEGLQPFWRNPDNPWVKAGWDIQQGFALAGAHSF